MPMRSIQQINRARRTAAAAVLLAFCLGMAGLRHSALVAHAGDQIYTFSFTISRSPLPTLYYKHTSYIVHLGAGASGATVTVGGIPAQGVRLDLASGDLVFTSAQFGTAVVTFASSSVPNAISAQKAALLDNKKWAWSHGMDDNVFLQRQIDAIVAKSWRATLFVIGQEVSPTRQEPDWIIDQPGLVALLNQGWNIGDHTWDHSCYNSDTNAKNILDGYAVVQRVVAASAHPDHTPISFAAPCFDTGYDAPFAAVRNGTTTLLVNETGGSALMNVDGSEYASDGRTATAMNGAITSIGRDTSIESDTSATAVFAWMAANATPARHFWFNTLTHGNQEARLTTVLNAAYTRYGPGGTNELWMAPEDEIYSYLLIRDATSIQGGTLTSGGVLAPTATLTPSALLPTATPASSPRHAFLPVCLSRH
jgi:peptidoglycan/xylan/chitin deacetylase (PgdA/CDA1 family)